MAQIRQISNFQIARVLWYLPEGSQEYRRDPIFIFSDFRISYVAKFG
jgi:hypothetical protein